MPLSDDFTFTAIDFERANNSYRSVCQVGVCVVEAGVIRRSYELFVRPPRAVCYFLKKPVEIHGITSADVAFAPTFDEVWKRILPDLEGRPLVAHSFKDDSMTLSAILAHYKIKYNYKKYGYLCTLELAQRADIHDDNNKFSLEALCARCGIPLEPHHAGSDAEGCARLALSLAEELSISSFRSLADFSQTPLYPEPELPEQLCPVDIEKVEAYISRLRAKKRLELLDCPRGTELGRAKRFIQKHPETLLPKEAAFSGRSLNQWFAALSLPLVPAVATPQPARAAQPLQPKTAQKTLQKPQPAKKKRGRRRKRSIAKGPRESFETAQP